MSDDKPTATVETDGVDRLDLWRKAMDGMEASIEANRIEQRAEADRAHREKTYGIRETLYFRVTPHKRGNVSAYKAECIAGLPGWVRDVSAVAETPEDAVHEARFGYAVGLFKSQLCKTMEAARERASRAELVIADVVK
jgi:hypothetical protein